MCTFHLQGLVLFGLRSLFVSCCFHSGHLSRCRMNLFGPTWANSYIHSCSSQSAQGLTSPTLSDEMFFSPRSQTSALFSSGLVHYSLHPPKPHRRILPQMLRSWRKSWSFCPFFFSPRPINTLLSCAPLFRRCIILNSIGIFMKPHIKHPGFQLRARLRGVASARRRCSLCAVSRKRGNKRMRLSASHSCTLNRNQPSNKCSLWRTNQLSLNLSWICSTPRSSSELSESKQVHC